MYDGAADDEKHFHAVIVRTNRFTGEVCEVATGLGEHGFYSCHN
jgi:hypothetical protein